MKFEFKKYVPRKVSEFIKEDTCLRKISKIIKENETFWYGMIGIFIISLVAFWYIGGNRPFADEVFHYKQIRWFNGDRFEMYPNLTNIPGYHITIALFTKLVGNQQMIVIRFFSIMLSLLSIPIFYKTYKKISNSTDKEALIRTLQFYFFPLFFPFIFLVYTDMFSLMLVLASMFMMVKKRYSWSGFFAILSYLVRQNNILWLIFIPIYGYFSQNGFDFDWKRILSFSKKIWTFILGAIGFALFVLINGGIAVGDKTHHVAGFYLGNIYFMLFMMFVFFLPYHIENFPKIVRRIKKNPWALLLPIGVAALFLVALPALHPYNFTPHFVRNDVLRLVYSQYMFMVIYAVCVGYASLSLLEFGLTDHALVLFPFAILSAMPEWLIEQRYYIVAIALFMLLRKNKSAKAEYVSLVWYVLIGVFFFVGIANQWFML